MSPLQSTFLAALLLAGSAGCGRTDHGTAGSAAPVASPQPPPPVAPPSDAAEPMIGGPGAPNARRISGVAGTAYFAPDGRSFWVQNNDGDALVHLGLDGKELGRVSLDDKLEDASLWIRFSRARRPLSPDGSRLLESRTETDGKGHTAFIVDLKQRREDALPLDEYTDVDWLADGRLLVVSLGTMERRPAAILDLATKKQTPLCAKVEGLSGVLPTGDGRGLIVQAKGGVFEADLACAKKRQITSEERAFPRESPSRKAWLALVPSADHVELRVLEPSPRSVGTSSMDGVAWLDDDRFVFTSGDHAVWARASSAAPAAPIVAPQAGCADHFISGPPSGGTVVFARTCGEGSGSVFVVTSAP